MDIEIDEELGEVIKNEAQLMGLGINTLANLILARYLHNLANERVKEGNGTDG